MTDHVTQADAADLIELDVFLAAYADRHDYERIANVVDPNDDLLSLGLLRRVLARLSAELAARSGGWEAAKDQAVQIARERVAAYAGWPAPFLLNAARHGEAEAILAAISSMEAPSQ